MLYLERTAKIQAVAGLYRKIDPAGREYLELQAMRLMHQADVAAGFSEWKYYKSLLEKGKR